MKANVIQEDCVGCGLCASVCPDVFIMSSDGKAKVTNEDISSSMEDDVLDAESSCPVDAITVVN